MLESRILVNLDSEEDDALYAGCAGSRTTKISLPLKNEPKPPKYRVAQVEVKGLKAGIPV